MNRKIEKIIKEAENILEKKSIAGLNAEENKLSQEKSETKTAMRSNIYDSFNSPSFSS